MCTDYVQKNKLLSLNISIEQIRSFENISIRALNVCKKNNLNYLHEVIDYYHKNKSFSNIKACGAKTEKELIRLCLKYHDNIELNNLYQSIRDNEQKHLSTTYELEFLQINFNQLNRLQRSILNQYFKNRIKSLSKRTLNCLSNIDIDNNFQNFYKAVSKPEFSIRNLKNVGKKTEQEFNDFWEEICQLSNLLQSQANAQSLYSFFVYVVVKDLEICEKYIEGFSSDFFEGRFPLFRFINLLISKGYLFSDRELQIFYHRFNYYADKETFTLDKLSEQLSTPNQDKLTRERVRQLSLTINPILEGKLSHLFICFPYTNYDISFQEDQDFIYFNNDFADRINISENVKFTPKFYTKIFSIFIGDSHTLFPIDIRDDANIYLIKKELFEFFDFNAFYLDIEHVVNNLIPQTYAIHFEGYLYNFLKGDDLLVLEKIFPICELIALEDFNLFVDTDGNLIFEKNTKKIVEDYAIEVLHENGYPMHLTDIYSNIEMKYPDEIANLRNLQAAMQRSNRFIFLGNSSTYGLKEWEQDKERAIKGGTFKDIVEQFLDKCNEPKHISEIYTHVSQYRDTNEQRLLGNLKGGNSSRFSFFYGGFVGLKNKKYKYINNFKKLTGSSIKISEEALIDAYYELKDEIGHNPTSIEMDKFGKYSYTPYLRCFGGWNKFLEYISEPSKSNIITKEDLINAYYELKENIGNSPTSTDMKVKGKYSLSPFFKIFGSWNNFLISIGENNNSEENVKRNTERPTKVSEEDLINAYKLLRDELGYSPTSRDINDYGQYSVSTYYSKFGSWSNFLELIGETTKRKSIPKKDLISAYFDLKKKLGKSPSSTEMDKIGKYSLTAYYNRFGTWKKFLESIGENLKNKSISEKELIAAYYQLQEKLGRMPTATEMNEFGKYSSSVYYSRFGGWKKLLKLISEDNTKTKS